MTREKELKEEIERFEYLDNKGQHILPVNKKEKDNWYEWKKLKDKFLRLKAELEGIQEGKKIKNEEVLKIIKNSNECFSWDDMKPIIIKKIKQINKK